MSIDEELAKRDWERERGDFVGLIGVKLESVHKGKAVMRMPFRREITNGTGAVHGGAILSLCDTTFYVALASIYGREQETTTASLTCSFLRRHCRHTTSSRKPTYSRPAVASYTARCTFAAATRSSRIRP